MEAAIFAGGGLPTTGGVPAFGLDTAPAWVTERLQSRAALHRNLEDTASLLQGERGLVSEHPKVVEAAKESLASASAALQAEARSSGPGLSPASRGSVPDLWQRSQAFLTSASEGLQRTFEDGTHHPAAPAVILHQVQRGDGEALRAAILSDTDRARAALAAFPRDPARAAAALGLARTSLDLRVDLGGSADPAVAGALEAARAAVAYSNSNVDGADAAVQAAAAAVDASAARAAFAAGLRSVENAKAAAEGDSALAGSEPWAWRRLAALEVGLGLESVEKAGAAAPVPSKVLAGLGRLTAHLEKASEEPGARVLLRSAVDALTLRAPALTAGATAYTQDPNTTPSVPTPSPSWLPSMSSNAITQAISSWWPFGQGA